MKTPLVRIGDLSEQVRAFLMENRMPPLNHCPVICQYCVPAILRMMV